MASFNPHDAIPDSSVCIVYWDTSYPQLDGESFSDRLKRKIEKENQSTLHHVDIHPGASGPAFLLELSLSQVGIAAVCVTLFFQGKTSLKTWMHGWECVHGYALDCLGAKPA